MKSKAEVLNFLREKAQLYEKAVIKLLRNKLLNTSYASQATNSNDADIIRLVLGLQGAAFTGPRIRAKNSVELVDEGRDKDLNLSKERKQIIEYLSTLDPNEEKNIDDRIRGVKMEQIGYDYAKEVIRVLFNNRNVRLKSSPNGYNYDWSLRFRLGRAGLTEEEQERLKEGVNFEHKSKLSGFHITTHTVNLDLIDDDIKQDADFHSLSLHELIEVYLLLQKFNNNYPIFFSVEDQNFLFASDVLSEEKNISLQDTNINKLNIEQEAKNIYQQEFGFSEDEKDIYFNELEKNKNLYLEFEKIVIQDFLYHKKIKGSLWYGKQK